jgi:hypothetical protein
MRQRQSPAQRSLLLSAFRLVGRMPTATRAASGFEVSSISPPGSSEEVPGGAPELIAFLKSEFGKAGPAVSSVAKLHEGSHEACDEAVEG